MSEQVYVLSNPSFPPNLLKIGKTTRDIKQRVKELSKPTGVPTSFVLVMKIRTDNSNELEKLIHTRLAELRIPNKEFFKISEEALYSILTDELKFTVEKITETDDSQDSEGGDSEEGDTDTGTDDDNDHDNSQMLAPKYKKLYKHLEKTTTSVTEFFRHMSSKNSEKYDIIKYSPTKGGDDDDEVDDYDRKPRMINKLNDYKMTGAWLGSTTDFDRFQSGLRGLIQRISWIDDGIHRGNSNLEKKNEELRLLNKKKKYFITEKNKCHEKSEIASGYDEHIKFVDEQIKNLKEKYDEFKEDDNYIKKEIINILKDKEYLEEKFKKIHEWY